MSLSYSLVKALADVAIFLEFSDEDSVNPDSAVAAMEQIAADLKDLHADDRAEFLKLLEKVASDYDDEEKSRFVASLHDSFGI